MIKTFPPEGNPTCYVGYSKCATVDNEGRPVTFFIIEAVCDRPDLTKEELETKTPHLVWYTEKELPLLFDALIFTFGSVVIGSAVKKKIEEKLNEWSMGDSK